MKTIIDLFLRNPWNALGCVVELLGYFLRFVSVFFRIRASLAARLTVGASSADPAAVLRLVRPSMPRRAPQGLGRREPACRNAKAM